MAQGKKTGGRGQGTPNRLTKELRTALKNILHQEIELLANHLENLEPKDRLEILIKLLPFVVPKVDPVNHNTHEPVQWD